MRRLRLSLALVAVAALAIPASAPGSSIYSQVLQAYQANGRIPPCQFTSAQLAAALKGVDTYGEQYFADFTDAIQNALAARASGACLPASALSGAAPSRRAAATTFEAPAITGSSAANLPAAVVALALLTLLLGAGAGLVLLAAKRGWARSWTATARHGAGETGYRLGDWWDQLVGRLGSRRAGSGS